jgi:acyl-CoA dehydrogenase
MGLWTHIRRATLTTIFFRWFKKILPAISSTEQEVIDVGDVWWEGELFQGQPNWNILFNQPFPTLSKEETDFLNNQVETLCRLLDDWKITHEQLDLSKEAWSYLKEEGFLGMIIPKKYGGLEFSALANSTIVQKIATRSVTAAVTAMVPNSLGPAELLLAYGTEEQKEYYLPRLARGDEIPCFALTGPEAGSDAGSIPDVGIVCRGQFQGEDMIGMRLTWDKRYLTLAPVATVLGLAFKLFDPEGLLGDKKELGITLCLLPTHIPGFEIGNRHFPLNQSFLNGPTRGKDVFVPLDWIIGGPSQAGKGWRMLMECLSAGRGISLPALSTAAAKLCYRTTGAYARIRKQFNVSIGQFEGVTEVLARIGGITYLLEATRLLTLIPINQHMRPGIATAIAKYHMTEFARKAVNDAMDIHGGRGIMMGPHNYLARCYQSIPITITVEGANILTRNLIIFGQGVIRCHPYLRGEIQALSNPNETKGIEELDAVLGKHMGYVLSNFTRLIVSTFTGGWISRTYPLKPFQRSIKQLSRMSLALSFISDMTLLMFGGKLKRYERLSARLSDVLSYLYLASAALKYFKEFGDQEDDVHYTTWAVTLCLYRIQESFLSFFENIPVFGVGTLFRLLVFPTGRAYTLPSDALEHKLAQNMMHPNALRGRLVEHCYLGDKNESSVAELEYTLQTMIKAEPALKKLSQALKMGTLPHGLDQSSIIQIALDRHILTNDEANIIREFETARLKAIAVDEFTKEQLHRQE